MRVTDKDYKNGKKGDRTDNRNLIDDWNQAMERSKMRHKFIWNLTEFEKLKPNVDDHILG